MIATYECEQCFKEYSSDFNFVTCRGDACREEVCKKCATPCKDPKCHNWVCPNCRNYKYMDGYCIDCAIFFDDEDEESINFDYVGIGWGHKRALSYVHRVSTKAIQRNERKYREKFAAMSAASSGVQRGQETSGDTANTTVGDGHTKP